MRSVVAVSISLASLLVVVSSDGVGTSLCGDEGGCEAPGPEEVLLLQHKVHLDGQLEGKPGKLDNFKGEQAAEKEKQVLRTSSEQLLKDSGKIRERVPTLADHVTQDPSFEKILLAKQWAHSCYMDGSVRDTFMMNALTAGTRDCYMNLGALKLPGAMADGSSYRLELIWQLNDNSISDLVWTQTSSPIESTIKGFTAISEDAANAHNFVAGPTCAKFSGLGKSPEGACVMDGNGEGDCFFNCAGTLLPWNGEQFIPGPFARKAQGFELYLLRLPHASYDYQLLARQVAGDCLMAAHAKKRFMTNAQDPEANCYMCLDQLMEPGAKADDQSYYFELKWTLDDDSIVSVVWSQTSLPTQPTIEGFQAINALAVDANGYSVGATCAKFTGLGKSSDAQCIMDGNGDGNCFFNCAGLVGNWFDGQFIPGPMERKAKKFELYLLMKKPYSYELVGHNAMGAFQEGIYDFDLDKLDRLSYPKADGHSYYFQLEWQIIDGNSTYVTTMRWAQSSSPKEHTIRGFRALDANAMAAYDHPVPGAGFRGLGMSSTLGCYLDGNGADPGMWSCVGLWMSDMSIPGPMSMQASSVKLYLLRVTKANVHYELFIKQGEDCLFEGYQQYGGYNDRYPHAACYFWGRGRGWDRWSVIWILEDSSQFEVIWQQAESPWCHYGHSYLWGQCALEPYTDFHLRTWYLPLNMNAVIASSQGDNCTNFYGMGASNSDGETGNMSTAACIFDGNGLNECNWNCIGLKDVWPAHPGFIPGPMGMKARQMKVYRVTDSHE